MLPAKTLNDFKQALIAIRTFGAIRFCPLEKQHSPSLLISRVFTQPGPKHKVAALQPLRGSKSRGAGRSYAGALIRGEAAAHIRQRQDAQRQSHRIVSAELGEPDVAVVLLKFAEERASACGKRAPRCQAGRDKIDRQA